MFRGEAEFGVQVEVERPQADRVLVRNKCFLMCAVVQCIPRQLRTLVMAGLSSFLDRTASRRPQPDIQ